MLSAVCRYLERYRTEDSITSERIFAENFPMSFSIKEVMYQIILSQVIEALKGAQREIVDDPSAEVIDDPTN